MCVEASPFPAHSSVVVPHVNTPHDSHVNIDFHFHHLPEFFVDELRGDNPWGKKVEPEAGGEVLRVGALDFALGAEHYRVDEMLRVMDERSIDLAALSPSPLLFHYQWDPSLVIPLHRRVNDHLAELRRVYPDRFAPLGTLPMQEPKVALEELERCMELGLSGVEIETNVAGANLDAPSLFPIFERAAELGAVIFLHPAVVLGIDRLRDHYLSNLIGNPTDTAVAVASLIFGGVLDRCPDLKVVCAHGGVTTACLCGRWDHGARVRPELAHLERSPREALRGLYYDTLTHSDEVLGLLLEVVGWDRLVLGSDFPYDMGDPDPVGRIESSSRLTPPEKQAVLGETAARLLGRPGG